MQNKNIIRFCFLCIFFIVIANIILYRQLIVEKVILGKVTKNNELLVSTYLNYASHFCDNIFKDDTSIDSAIKPCSNQSGLNDFSKKFFSQLGLIKVMLIDENNEVIFDTNNVEIVPIDKSVSRAGKEIAPLLDYLIFKDLISNKKLMLNAIVKSNNAAYKNANIVRDEQEIHGIDGKKYKMHFFRDISELWREMSLIEVKIFFAISGFFIVLFIIILYNTRFAQRIIDKQIEANKELIAAKKKAEQESSSKSQFLANVSHELRTPLNSIIGFSEIILSDKDNSKKSGTNFEYIQDIHASGKHLLALINDILDYSRITAGQLPIDMIELNINKIATYSMRFFEPRADQAGIELIKDFPKEPPVIKADSKRLRQALLNVISNAVKFTPKGGSVTVKIEKSKDNKKVYIKIIDTGIGIAKENISKALTSFKQIDDKKDRHYEGTGLGLPLTKKLIELMKAKFEIKSSEGKGTTITFTFKAV